MSYKTILVENGTKKEIVLKEYGVRENTSGGSSSFTGLIDTPTTYSGQAGKVVTVKGDEGGIEFTDLSTAGLQKVEDDTAPKLGGDLELGGFELTQASGNDFAIDVAGLATGDDFIIKSGASELLNLSFDSDTSEMLLDLSKSGLSTRIIGLPTNQTPISSEALSYQYLVDNGVLNPMVDNLDAGKQSIIDTKMLFFGETDEPEASGFGIQAVSSGAIPAITSSKTAEFTTLDSENTIVIAPEIGQPIMVTGDGGASVTMTYPSLDGTEGQVLTTNGAGVSDWADAAQDAPVDSVDGRTGVITLDDLYAPIVHTHTKSEITDFSDDDYATSIQGDLADTSIQAEDLDYGTFVGEDTDGFTGFLTKVEDDLTPKLGGDLETNGNDINGGTGNLTLNSFVFPTVDGTNGQVLVTNGANGLEFRTVESGSGSSDWNDITNKPTEFTPETHTHTEAQITDLDKYTVAQVDAALALKQDQATAFNGSYGSLTGVPVKFTPEDHTHTEADITDLDKYTKAEVDAAILAGGGASSWNDLTDKPTEFAPSAHTHTESEITDLDKYTKAEVDAAIAGVVTFSGDYNDLANTPTEFTPEVHTHVKSEITDFSDDDYATSAQGDTADSAVQPTELDFGTYVGEDTDGFAGFLTKVEDDLTPKLGGDLETNGNDINGGTGNLTLNSFVFPDTDGTDGQVLVTNGTNELEFRTVSGGESAVTTVHGRTGDIVSENEDYMYYQVGADPIATGLISGAELSLNGTNIDHTSGKGVVIDTSDYNNPSFINLDFNSGTVPFDTTAGVATWVYIDFNGVTQTATTAPTREEIKQRIYLGFVVANNAGHVLVETFEQVGATANDLNELMKYNIGVKGGGNIILSQTTSFGLEDLVVYQPNINRRVNPLDPNVKTFTGGNPLTFSYMTQTGLITSTETSVQAGFYNPTGDDLVEIENNNSDTSIQYLYMMQDGSFVMLYGQRIYSSSSSGKRELDLDRSLLVEPAVLNDAHLLYAFAMEEDVSDLTDTGDAYVISMFNTEIPVTSVFDRTGDIVAEEGDYALYYASLIHTHTEADITDLDKYTVAEVDAAIAGATDDALAIKTKYESNADTNAFTDNDKAQTDLIQDLGTFTGETIQPNVDLKVALQDLETEVERSRPFDANVTLVEDFYEAVDAGVTHNTQIPLGTITNKSATADGRTVSFNYVNGTTQQFKLAYNDTFTEPYLWGGDGNFGEANATWVDVDIEGLVLGAVVTITFWIRRSTSSTPRLCTWTRDPLGEAELMFTDNGGTVDELGTITFTAGGPIETFRVFLQRVMLKEITINVQGTYSSRRLTDSSDVHITSPVLDDVLAYTPNNKWENVPITSMSAMGVLSSFQNGNNTGPELMQFIVDAIEEKLLSQQRVVKNITVRPANPEIGDQYFDSTLNKVLVWAGARWLDSNGNNV